MADLNNDGYDDLTGQQNPVINPQVANTLPKGSGGSVLTNDSSRVSPKVNVAWYDRTPEQTEAWRDQNFNTQVPVSQGTFNKLAAAGGKAGAISQYGLNPNAQIQEALSRYYGFKPAGPSSAQPARTMPNQFAKVSPIEYRPASWGTTGVVGGKNIYGSGAQRYAGMPGATTTGFVDPTRNASTSDPETIRETISANRVAGPASTMTQETMRENYGPRATNSGPVIPSGGTVTSPVVSVPRTGPVYAPAGGGLPKPTLPLVQTPVAPYRNTGRGD